MSDERETYDTAATEAKWRAVWDDLQPFRADDDSPREKKYALTMFPYPSGDLHMGHAEVTALHDVIARYWWQKGYEVLNPMGWDSFGLPAENAAIRNDAHPADYTYDNIATQLESFQRYGVSFDWSRRFNTSDPSYYRWTQWLFLKFHEKGLAYRKNSPVNWCPNDQTVLANEQVVDGACERCGAEVTKRELTQWYFRTTAYAQELLDGLDDLQPTWSDKVVNSQRNWIGRSEGAHVDFVVEGREEPITVYTTRPDTLFGTTFMVVAVDSALAAELVTDEHRAELRGLPERGPQGDRDRPAVDRPPQDRRRPGRDRHQPGDRPADPGVGRRTTCWPTTAPARSWPCPAATSATGSSPPVMGLPIVAHHAAARRLRGRGLLRRGAGHQLPAEGESAPLDINGMGGGRGQVHDHRVPGGPGPGPRHGQLPAARLAAVAPALLGRADPDHPLPGRRRGAGPRGPAARRAARAARRRPEAQGHLAPGRARPTGSTSPAPRAAGRPQRDTDTMDTFVDSSWYFFRYVSPHDDTQAFDKALADAWGPIDLYVGGDEHAVLHLLYARFFTKALRDMGLVGWDEPFSAYLSQGKVINNGRKMSKSLGNGVSLGDQLEEFGVDAVRLTLVFASPPEDNIDWADVSPGGLGALPAAGLAPERRRHQRARDRPGQPATLALRKVTHKTLHDAATLVESHRFNVMVARTMELVNATRKAIDSGPGGADPAVREAVEAVAILLSLVAPYTAEEMWERLGHAPTVARVGWPTVDEALLVEDSVTAVVQVLGKVRARLEVSPDVSDADLEAAAMADAGVVRALDGRPVRKVVVRAPKLVNIVV